ncbi:hypothetical protein FOG51_01658 [Hanseniaspora uvarum]|nr:hypothetical protein FOG51_01658 [Hanseniaspora uvarum]KAF0276426.1 hypothetical protein FOG50_02718 [Hanseniaspora uvarum]
MKQDIYPNITTNYNMARRSNKNKATNQENEETINKEITSSSSSEEEDDHGDLINNKVDEDISNVLHLLKNNELDKLLNKENEFFKDEHFEVEKKIADKPLYLKDYQRDLLLSNNQEEKPFKTYQEEQDDQKNEIINEINAELSDKEDSDGEDFFTKKEKKTSIKAITDKLPELKEDESDDEKKEEFLQQFLDKQAWIPKTINEKGEVTVAKELGEYKTIENIADDDDEFDEAAEKFENAYNFRYEDPNSVEVVSYARQQATLRRDQLSSRQKKRLLEKEQKIKESSNINQQVQKTKTKMSKQMKDIILGIEKEYGKKIDDAMVNKLSDLLIDGDFDMNNWDALINELFDDNFYNEDGDAPVDMEGEFAEDEEAEEIKEVKEEKKLSKKKQKQLEKEQAKKDANKLDNIIENTLEAKKLNIIDTIKAPEERGRSRKQEDVKFRYREVSPNSFGLELREIFAAEDEQLNEFMPIKNFTNYKKKEEIMKERRKMLKKGKRLSNWRQKYPINFDEIVDEEHQGKNKKQKKSK